MGTVRTHPEDLFNDAQLEAYLSGPVISLFEEAEPVLPLNNDFLVKAYIDGEKQFSFTAKDQDAIEAYMLEECGGVTGGSVRNGPRLTIVWTDNCNILFTLKAIRAGA